MSKLIFFFTLIFFSLFFNSCSTTRMPGLKMLEHRANYHGDVQLGDVLENTPSLFVPRKTMPLEIDIYIHPHETAHGDYFRGGFLRSIVVGSRWENSQQGRPFEKEK